MGKKGGPAIERTVSVGVYQCEPAAADVNTNIATLCKVAEEASLQHGLDLLLFPELFLTGYNIGVERLRALAVAPDGPEIKRIRDIASICKIAIAFGYPERTRDRDIVFNSCCLVDGTGAVVLNYRKTHLWDPSGAGGYEKAAFAAGDSLPVCDLRLTRTGASVRVGALICYDAEFSEPCRVLALAGAELLLLPTGSGDGTPGSLCPARAQENHVFLAYCNLVGPLDLSSGRGAGSEVPSFLGGSAVLGPDGAFLAQAGRGGTALAVATLALGGEAHMNCVARNDYLAQRRPELYGAVAGSRAEAAGVTGETRHSTPAAEAPILFNAAGDSPMPPPVLARTKAFLDRESQIGGYAAAEEAAAEVERVYALLGRLVGAARPLEEIALVDSATTAWARAFYSIALRAGDIVLTTVMEYASNYLAMLQQSRRTGAEILVVPCGEDGAVSVPALAGLLADPSVGPRVRVVSVVWIPTNGGVVNDAAGLGAAIAASGLAADIVYMVDACQAAGQIAVDVGALRCQVLTGTGRKYLRGPRGTGFLYVEWAALERHFAEPVIVDLRAARWESTADYSVVAGARRFEQWEKNVAGLLGLGAAVDHLLSTVGEERAYAELARLARLLRRRLAAMDGVTVWDRGGDGAGSGNEGGAACGLVTFTVNGMDAQAIKAALQAAGVYVSVTTPGSSLLDAAARCLPDMVRASLHYCNSEAEIHRFCHILEHIRRNADNKC